MKRIYSTWINYCSVLILLFLLLMNRDGEKIDLCNYAHCSDSDCICKSSSEKFSWSACTVRSSSVTLQLHRGFYHERYRDIAKVSSPAVHIHNACIFLLFLSLFFQSPSSWKCCVCLVAFLAFSHKFSDLSTGFISSFSHCSKCWHCCLFKLVVNYCMPLIP